MADGFDTSLRGVTVEQFRTRLLDAAARTDVIQPAALREPVRLWLRAVEERARREDWRQLLGRPVGAAWNAAQAILDAPQVPAQPRSPFDPDGPLGGPRFAPC